VYTISKRKNASIFNPSSFSCGKVNLVGAFGRSKIKISNDFQTRREKQRKKIKEKRDFFKKSFFEKIDLGY